jgi:hypothetical protein
MWKIIMLHTKTWHKKVTLLSQTKMGSWHSLFIWAIEMKFLCRGTEFCTQLKRLIDSNILETESDILLPFLCWSGGDKTRSGELLSWQQTNQWSCDDIGRTKGTWTFLTSGYVLLEFQFIEICLKQNYLSLINETCWLWPLDCFVFWKLYLTLQTI